MNINARKKNPNRGARLEIKGAGYGPQGDEKRGLDAIERKLSRQFLFAVQNKQGNILIMDQESSTAVLSAETYRAFRDEIEACKDVRVIRQPS